MVLPFTKTWNMMKNKTVGTHDDEAGSSWPKRTRQHETVEEAMLPHVHHDFLLWGTSNRITKTKYNTNLARLHPKQIYSPCIVDWNVLNNMGYAEEIKAMLDIKVYQMGGEEEIFSSEAWRRAFDIYEPIYTELCHEFYSTYKFDEEVTDEELMTKKLIKFRLGGRGHTVTLLEFARRLGWYHAAEISEEGFEVYFQGGLRSDENFNARYYWLSISSEEVLHLSRSLTSTIRRPILKVLLKMITYGLCQRTTGYDKVQRNKLWLMSMFEAKHQNGIARRMSLLTDEVLDWLSALIYYRALDATTLRELIESNGRLIVEDPAPGVLRVAMPRPPRPTMQDLYDRMGNMKIRQGVLERMSRRQLYRQVDKENVKSRTSSCTKLHAVL
ncbi:hypothetical protein Tco_0145457 [Tanacetum coccineum]